MNTAPITYNPAPTQPSFVMPKGACDTHCHVFGPSVRFPFAPESALQPGDAPKEKLFALHDMMGIERCVIVQSGVHGFDNSAVANAIAARPKTYLGVALLPTDVSDDEIKRHHELGFRGIRFNYMSHLKGGASMDQLLHLADRLGRFDWHLQIHMDSDLIAEKAVGLAKASVPVVIDHMGRVDASLGLDQEPFNALLRLMENDHLLVKVSGCERSSRQDAPYVDAIPFARKLVETFPDRVLWGTDWPHPNFRADAPDDGVLVDLIAAIAPTPDLQQALLVDNPMRFYRFAA
ncbi:amidohydrolase family protein [Thalassospira alkalitolerans]|uniref:Amidohydrolase n=1 Tax=Thalassospira alkalitolerans TaxID=1293890 RepID=A0A1Y2LA21_9PROT|nr:amidohydrolase family protein [Thalassospira alkalitolerans]OSQ46220.1 amidohydrolase [Thalassospira alkalitolerans]